MRCVSIAMIVSALAATLALAGDETRPASSPAKAPGAATVPAVATTSHPSTATAGSMLPEDALDKIEALFAQEPASTADAPVPQASVIPLPRSQVRMATSLFEPALTACTFTRSEPTCAKCTLAC